jgi:hypothetical protein
MNVCLMAVQHAVDGPTGSLFCCPVVLSYGKQRKQNLPLNIGEVAWCRANGFVPGFEEISR